MMDSLVKTGGTRRLKNARHEAFCQHYAGKCWGNATQAYLQAGYAPKTRGTAAALACRLLKDGNGVRARVDQLREEAIFELGADRTRILQERMYILDETDAEGNKVDPAVRLNALRDIEKSMGLTAPDKVVHQVEGELKHTVKLDDELLDEMAQQVQVLITTWEGLGEVEEPEA